LVICFDVFEGDLESYIGAIGGVVATIVYFTQEGMCDILYHGFVIGFLGVPFDFVEFGVVFVNQIIDEGTNFKHTFRCFVLIVIDVVVDIDGGFFHKLVVVFALASGFCATGRGIGIGEDACCCEYE